MKVELKILFAFILNAAFSVFEWVGGMLTGSAAILSDAMHDGADTVSIGISYIFEKISKKQPDEKYTYGYARYSVLGGFITTMVLLIGSIFMICNGIVRIISPMQINYNGMIIFAIVGLCVNFCAAYLMRDGASVNQKAVKLHMLEDVLGWGIVLIGAVVMKFTECWILDPIMSIGVSVFILIHSVDNLRDITGVFLEKTPRNIDVVQILSDIAQIDGVLDVHHLHIWSLDGQSNCATLHIVTNDEFQKIKAKIRDELKKCGINHCTLELESDMEHCTEKVCCVETSHCLRHHHHHG